MPLQQDRFLRAIYDASADAIIVSDRDRRIVACNTAAEAQFGYREAELQGEATRMLYADPAQFDAEGAARFNTLARVDPGAVRIAFKRRDGSVFQSSTLASQIVDDAGRIVGFLGIIRDITDTVAAEEQIAAEREQFRRFYEKTPALLQVVDATGALESVSDAWLARFGYDRAAVIGRPAAEFFVGQSDRAAIDAMRNALARGGRCTQVPMTVRAADGALVEVELSAQRQDVLGAPRIIAALDDVSQRNAAMRRLESSNRALQDFAATAAHDLRAPLRHVSIYADMLAEAVAEQSEPATIARRLGASAQRLHALVDGLLALSRASQSEPALEDVTLGALVSAASAPLAGEIRAQGASLVCQTPNAALRVDAALMTGVFQALIDNSLRFAAETQPAIAVAAVEEAGSAWRITVSDNGVGVPAAHRERVFEPFRRIAPPARGETPAKEGVGLGLALCRSVVEAHGGAIWIDASGPDGTRIALRLPRRTAT